MIATISPDISTSSAKTIECKAGLTTLGKETGIFIESPKTNRRIVIPRGLYSDLPPRIASRIAQAAGKGVHRLPFSVEELKAVKSVHDEYKAAIQAAAEEELSNLRAAEDASAVPSALGTIINILPEKRNDPKAEDRVKWRDEQDRLQFGKLLRISDKTNEGLVRREPDNREIWLRMSRLEVVPAVKAACPRTWEQVWKQAEASKPASAPETAGKVLAEAGTIRAGQYTIGIWIDHPTAGRKIELRHEFSEAVPNDVQYRIIMETTGAAPKSHVEFTPEELQAILDQEAKQEQHRLNPPPKHRPIDVGYVPYKTRAVFSYVK